MNQYLGLWRKLILVALALVVSTALLGVAWAQEDAPPGGDDDAASSSSGGSSKFKAYVAPYALVVLCVGLGVLAVCKSALMRDRPKGEKYESVGLAELVVGKRKVPVVSVGMRMDQVTRMLGKPEIARRGEDIYRELAQAGKLSEDAAAKEYLIYEHRAGRYELVILDRHVVQVKTQPVTEEA